MHFPISPFVASVLFTALAAAPALAEPVDLGDPTPRTVLAQVDEDITDYGAIGAGFGTPVEADFASDGTTAVVTVAGAVIEALVEEVFAGAATVVPGSFTDYVVVIDVASGAVLSAEIDGEVTVPILGTIAVSQSASSGEVAGFRLQDIFGFELPIYCTGGTNCTIVPGLAYDPATGQFNAVGMIASAFDIFTPFGDIKLSEVPSPLSCDVEMSQPTYVDGEPVVLTSLRFGNTAAGAIPARLRLQLGLPFGFAVDVLDLGAGGGFAVPGAFDKQLGPVTMFTLQPGQPRGSLYWRCALEDQVTGAIIVEDVAPFEFQ